MPPVCGVVYSISHFSHPQSSPRINQRRLVNPTTFLPMPHQWACLLYRSARSLQIYSWSRPSTFSPQETTPSGTMSTTSQREEASSSEPACFLCPISSVWCLPTAGFLQPSSGVSQEQRRQPVFIRHFIGNYNPSFCPT